MQYIKKSWLIASLILLTSVGSVLADTVTLNNGDRLSGSVVHMRDGILVFASTYAGDIEIPWEAVVNLSTDAPITTQLINDSQITGPAIANDDGTIRVDADAVLPSVSFAATDVAAINPPTAEELAPKTEYNTIVNVGVTATSGNSDTQQYHLDAEFNARNEKNRYNVGVDFNRGEDDGETIVDNWTVYTNYDYFFTEKFFWNNSITLQQNDLQELDLRTALSTGIGYQYYDTDDLKLSTTVGIGYISEDFAVQPSERSIAGRWSLDYEHQWFEWLSFFHNHEGLVSLEDTNDFIIRSRTGLRYPLAKYLTGTAQVNFNYDNSPSLGTEKEDLTYILSIGYAWK